MAKDPREHTEDPQVAALAREIEAARGKTLPFLVWSGQLPEAASDRQAVNALVGERWWLFSGSGELDEIDEEWATELLTWLLGRSQAYDAELMPREQAARLAARFIALLPARRRWFTNGDRDDTPPDGLHPRPTPFTPLTEHTFDTGVVAAAEGRAWIAWFTDED